ncbi:hypothetical protein MMPV_002049 [Pyropia vietnamensis]
MVDACESRLELHLSGRSLRDLDLFSKSDPFAVLYIDEASAGGGWVASSLASAPVQGGSLSDEWGAVSGAPSSRSAAAALLPPPRDRRSSLLSGWRHRPRVLGRAEGGADPSDRRASTSAVRPPSSRAPWAGGPGRTAKAGRSGGQEVGAAAGAAPRSWRWVGATETIRDVLNPQWVTALQVPYFFERSQHLRVEVYDRDAKAPVVPGRVDELSRHDFIGAAEVRIPEVVRAPGQRVELPLAHPRRGSGGKNGWLTILAEEVGAWKQVVTMDMGLERVKVPLSLASKPSVFVALSRYVAATQPGAGGAGGGVGGGGSGPPSWIRVHKTAPGVPSSRVRGSYTFPRSKLSVQTLCRCEPDAPLRAEVVLSRPGGAGGERVISQAPLSFRTLMEARRVPLTAPAPPTAGSAMTRASKVAAGRAPGAESTHGGKELGAVVMNDVRVLSSATFLDYIMGGCEVNLVVAIDFTASNGDPTRPGTLHHIGGVYGPNEYESAIRAVGDILALYDSDGLFPAYGFGAKLSPSAASASHCFSLTDSPNPTCVGIDGVLAAYRRTLSSVRLSGPTILSEIIRAAAASAAASRPSQAQQAYTLALILTDGVVNDMGATIAELTAAASLPLSIVIVGVGDADFSDMVALDGDDIQGGRGGRDIVQFVAFRTFAGEPERLAAAVLEELPGQMTSFFRRAGIRPNPPVPLQPGEMVVPQSVTTQPPPPQHMEQQYGQQQYEQQQYQQQQQQQYYQQQGWQGTTDPRQHAAAVSAQQNAAAAAVQQDAVAMPAAAAVQQQAAAPQQRTGALGSAPVPTAAGAGAEALLHQQQASQTVVNEQQTAVASDRGGHLVLPAANTGWTGAAAAPRPVAPAAQAEWAAATARAAASSTGQQPPPTDADPPEELVARPAGYPPGPGAANVVAGQEKKAKKGKTTQSNASGGVGDWGGTSGATNWDTPSGVAASGHTSRHGDSGSMDMGVHAPPVGVQQARVQPSGTSSAGRSSGSVRVAQADERTNWSVGPSHTQGRDDGWDTPPGRNTTNRARTPLRSGRDNGAAVAAAHADRQAAVLAEQQAASRMADLEVTAVASRLAGGARRESPPAASAYTNINHAPASRRSPRRVINGDDDVNGGVDAASPPANRRPSNVRNGQSPRPRPRRSPRPAAAAVTPPFAVREPSLRDPPALDAEPTLPPSMLALPSLRDPPVLPEAPSPPTPGEWPPPPPPRPPVAGAASAWAPPRAAAGSAASRAPSTPLGESVGRVSRGGSGGPTARGGHPPSRSTAAPAPGWLTPPPPAGSPGVAASPANRGRGGLSRPDLPGAASAVAVPVLPPRLSRRASAGRAADDDDGWEETGRLGPPGGRPW